MKNFVEVFKERSKFRTASVLKGTQQEIILKSISYLDKKNDNKDRGVTNLDIVMEELAELIQRVSKHKRGTRDENSRIKLLEEVADVTLAIEYIKEIVAITDAEIELAKDIKLERLEGKMLTDTFQ
jgi:NTP pyrophosphatase (non-canonical NTP hydrolase)